VCWDYRITNLSKVPTRIAQENTFLHVRLQRAALVLLNEDICNTARLQTRYIWFALESSLIGSHALERECRKEIPDVDLSIESISPKRRW